MVSVDRVSTHIISAKEATVDDKNQQVNSASSLVTSVSHVSQTDLTSATNQATAPLLLGEEEKAALVRSCYDSDPDLKNFVAGLINKEYTKIDYKEVCKTLEKFLSLQPECPKLTAAQQLKAFFTAVSGGLEGTIEVLNGIIKKEQAEISLFEALENHPEFKSFPKEHAWRLVVDFYQQEKRGEYGFEDEPGYTAAMFNAFAYMVTHIDEQITAQNLLYLHDLAVDDVLDKPDARQNPVHLMDGNDLIHIRKGYRETTYFAPGFYLSLPHPGATPGRYNATTAGLHELWTLQKQSELDTSKKPAFTLSLLRNYDANGNLVLSPKNDQPGDAGVAVKLSGFAGTAQECEARAQEMIDAYHQELALANTSDEKLIAIARLCRSLESAHFFHDGNARTIGIIFLNKLLLQNGFSPVILTNPNVIDGFSLAELVAAIRQGQKNFNAFVKLDNDAFLAETTAS